MIDEMNNWNRKVEHIAGICEYEKRTYGKSPLEKFVKRNTPIVEWRLLSNIK